MLNVTPIDFAKANAFVFAFHRHHKPTAGCKFCVAVRAVFPSERRSALRAEKHQLRQHERRGFREALLQCHRCNSFSCFDEIHKRRPRQCCESGFEFFLRRAKMNFQASKETLYFREKIMGFLSDGSQLTLKQIAEKMHVNDGRGMERLQDNIRRLREVEPIRIKALGKRGSYRYAMLELVDLQVPGELPDGPVIVKSKALPSHFNHPHFNSTMDWSVYHLLGQRV